GRANPILAARKSPFFRLVGELDRACEHRRSSPKPADAHCCSAACLKSRLAPQIAWCQTYDMTAAKRHITSLRDEYAEMTRQRIVAASVETLEHDAADDIYMA